MEQPRGQLIMACVMGISDLFMDCATSEEAERLYIFLANEIECLFASAFATHQPAKRKTHHAG